MSKFVRSISITKQFDGDTVTFTLRPMSYAAALQFHDLREKTQEEQGKFSQEAMREHLTSVSGATDAAGNHLGVEDLLGAAYFIPLIGEVTAAWVQESMPGN